MKNKVIKISLGASALVPLGLIATSCSNSSSIDNVKWIGHRGASGKVDGKDNCPQVMENTYASYKAACEYTGSDTYWGVETDVYPTADGKYVCVHDAYCFRDSSGQRITTEGSEVYKYTLAEAKKKDLIYSKNFPKYFPGFFDPNGEKSSEKKHYEICDFNDYLKLCKDYDKTAVIEIKQDGRNLDIKNPEASVWNINNLPGLYETIKKSGVNFCLISFDNAALEWLHEQYPNELNAKNMQMLYDPDNEVEKYRDFNWFINNGYSIDVGDRLSESTTDWGIEVTKELVDKFHAKNLLFNVWTVDTLPRAVALADMGVDFITSDYARSTIPTTYLGK